MHASSDGRSAVNQSTALAVVVFLIATAVLISYVDRGNLSIAAPTLKTELNLTASHLGLLLSAFFWSYTVMLFASAFFIDRFDVSYVLAAGFLVWSAATVLTGWVYGFAALFAVRVLLGLGEAVTFPSYSKILAQNVPEERRGFANGAIIAAMKLGPAVGTLLVGLLMARFGWRAVFIGTGLVSLMLLPAWLRFMPRGQHRILPTAAPPALSEIFRKRSFWGSAAGLFCNAYVLYFTITWLPYYLAHEHGLSTREMTWVATSYYVSDSVGALLMGMLTDVLIRRGRRAGVVRKFALGGASVVASAAFLRCSTAGPNSYIGWLVLAGFAFGCANSGVWAFIQTLAGPRAVARWASLANGCATFAGVIGPILTGVTVDRTGTFHAAIAIVAAICLLNGAMWTVVIGEFRAADWDMKPPTGSWLRS